MIIIYYRQFKKHFKKRILPDISLVKRFDERIKLFISDRVNPILADHPLGGDYKGYRSFSITGDIRVIYKFTNSSVIFIDVGTHNQVYR